ncbi:hypothetical protein J3458_011696 [Metarhizium acridum]|uniref:uncharacterized protein n=1 Tax=Metarhizium acridum TaxID=92637 RepID=UPI001C6BD42E|nr:hypothetical protein J3458_011696 [Metarhizium acridum]
MADDRGMSTELKEVWGDDTVYSASFYQPEDVLYEGSEDEGYENSATRRRRYEAAGQRFLDGAVPALISAALRGPFDRRSGFINPWISHRHEGTARSLTGPSKPVEKATSQSKNSVRKPKPDPTLQARYAGCHLPSPESLKQAPYTQEHPYLAADRLEKVNKWREQIDPFPDNRNGFLVSDDAEASTSIRKRSAPGSEWLKKVSTKRHRSATSQKQPHRQEQEDDEPDELMADLPSSSFENVAPVMSPSKRRSPRNAMRRNSCKGLVESDDELSPNKAAAATLSSPVSLRNCPVICSSSKGNQPPDYITSSIGTQTTPSRLRHVRVLDTLSKNRSPSQEDQTGDGPNVKPQAASGQVIEATVENISETGSVTESEPETIADEDDNGSAMLVGDDCIVVNTTCEDIACEDATSEATNSQPENQRYGPELPPSKLKAEMDGNSDPIAQRTDSDVKMHDLPSMKSEPQGVAQCAVPGSTRNPTGPDNNGNPDNAPMKQLDIPVAQSDDDRVMNMESGDEIVAHEGGADVKLENNLSDMDSEDDSGNSSAATHKTFSMGNIVPDRSQDTNHASTSDDIAVDDGKTVSIESKSSTTSTMRKDMQSDSESVKPETPTTPRQAERVKEDASEFRFKTIFNRFVLSSPGNRLTRLALSPSSSPSATSSKKFAVTNESADQIVEADAQASQTHKKELPSPRRNELISDFGHLHEPAQPEQKVSYSQSDRQLKDPETEDQRIPESQQSPWVNTDDVILSRSPLGMLSLNISGAKPSRNEAENIATVSPSDIQSPWIQNTSSYVASFGQPSSSPSNENVEQSPFAKPSRPRPRTPEPQFYLKSFSSFMSPSPDRNRGEGMSISASRQVFRSTQGSLPSSLKSRWSQKHPGLRVSWAASLEEFEGTPGREDACAARHMPKRQNSPPPETLGGDFRQAHDTKFAKHFEAVANRRDGQSQNLIPTESQQLQSPGPFAMAETFMTADTNTAGPVCKDMKSEEHIESLACSRASEEPMDVVEDMVREMGDFWDSWNIDAELEQARKGVSGGQTSLSLGREG